MQVYYAAGHQPYHPKHSFFTGRFTPYPDVPARADALLAAIQSRPGYDLMTPPALGEGTGDDTVQDAALGAAHDPAYLEALRDLCTRLKDDEAFYPFHMAGHALLAQSPYPRLRVGQYALDGATPLLRTSWAAALSAAESALAASHAVAGGAREAYALCRPPGHHAGRALYAGYCLLNNAALAALALLPLGRVAVLDVDYHHGNGTQDIFWEREEVFYASLHCHPREAYPYVTGAAEERGSGAGLGGNLNLPLPGGTDWAAYAPALETALEAIAAHRPAVLVLSLGFDTLESDPIGSFALRRPDYRAMGQRIRQLNLPTVLVQEGGYHVEALQDCLTNFLDGWEAGT